MECKSAYLTQSTYFSENDPSSAVCFLYRHNIQTYTITWEDESALQKTLIYVCKILDKFDCVTIIRAKFFKSKQTFFIHILK